MDPVFLLLELLDPEVNALLWRMREIVSGRHPRVSAVHLTVRGPYASEPYEDVMKRARKLMAGDVLRIYGVGRFSNPDGEVVFLRVESPHLRDIWWKPSYPGFEPHISVYRGADTRLADVIEQFLFNANVDISCAEHRLVWHRSGQRDLFDRNEPTVEAMQMFMENGRLNADLLDHLSNAIDSFRNAERRVAG